MQVKMSGRRAGRGNRHELTNVCVFYCARDALNELVSKVTAAKENSFAE